MLIRIDINSHRWKMMFTRFLVIPILVLFSCCLLTTNDALLTQPSGSVTTTTANGPATTVPNKNLTCEEFCANSKMSNGGERHHLHHQQHQHQHHHEIIVKEQILRANGWLHQQLGHKTFANEEYLRQSSIIFGLAQIANEDYLSARCFGNLKELAKSILQKDVWAMKVLDSSGSKKPGFLWGHNYWLGSRDGCEAVQRPVYITLSDQFERSMKQGLIHDLAPFEMDYRVAHIRHHSPWQVEIKFMSERTIQVGLCLPKSCNNDEIKNLTQTYFEWGFFEEANTYDINPQVIEIKDLKLKPAFFDKISLKIVSAILIFTVTMIVLALCQNPICDEKKPTIGRDRMESSSPSQNEGLDPTKRDHDRRDVTDLKEPIYNFIKCFDLISNGRSLFSLKQDTTPSEIPIIDGLRSISCIWIMVFHVIWYMYFTVDNKIFLISLGERAFFQYISTSPILVDVFFTISGFLSAFNFIRNDKNLQRIASNSSWENFRMYGKMVLHRYLRLAPLYLVLTGIVELFTAYVADVSLFHIHERNDETCSKYWWRNILFIQNLFGHQDLCANWTWSLACEMQFYLIVSGLLFFYVKYPRVVKNILIVSFLSSIVWTGFIGFQYKYRISFDVIYSTGTQLYINPFIRITPYLLGCGAGWFLATSKGQFSISPTYEKCAWNLAIIVFFACLYSTVKRDMSLSKTVLLYVFGRLLFSVSVCWMIIGSAIGQGVWWSKILELNFFQHVNKLSYAIYLLNPLVISFIFSLSSASTHADPFMLCALTSGFAVIVYICSIIFSLSFEMPYYNLSTLLLQRKVKTA